MNSGVFHENDDEVIVGTIREKFQHGRNNLACSLSATNNPCCNWGKRRKGLLDKSTKWKRFLVHHFGQNENFQDREFSSPNTSLYFWKHKSFRWRQPNQSLQHTFWGPLAIFAQLDVMRLVVKHNSKRGPQRVSNGTYPMEGECCPRIPKKATKKKQKQMSSESSSASECMWKCQQFHPWNMLRPWKIPGTGTISTTAR